MPIRQQTENRGKKQRRSYCKNEEGMGPLGASTDGGRLSRRKAFKKEDIGPPFVSSCDQNFNVAWPFLLFGWWFFNIGAHGLGLVLARDRHHTLGQRAVHMPARDLSLPRLAHASMALAQRAVQRGALSRHCGLGAFTFTHLRLVAYCVYLQGLCKRNLRFLFFGLSPLDFWRIMTTPL